MGIKYEENKIIFDGFIDDDQVIPLREYLSNIIPNEVELDFINCRDIHTAILQVILAYKALCSVKFIFPEQKKLYIKALESLIVREDNSN